MTKHHGCGALLSPMHLGQSLPVGQPISTPDALLYDFNLTMRVNDRLVQSSGLVAGVHRGLPKQARQGSRDKRE